MLITHTVEARHGNTDTTNDLSVMLVSNWLHCTHCIIVLDLSTGKTSVMVTLEELV